MAYTVYFFNKRGHPLGNQQVEYREKVKCGPPLGEAEMLAGPGCSVEQALLRAQSSAVDRGSHIRLLWSAGSSERTPPPQSCVSYGELPSGGRTL